MVAGTHSRAGNLVLRVLTPLGAAFLLSNFYRSLNAVLSPYLIADLHLTARQLGLLTSIYFFTSAVFQAPLGLLMDRYGPRRVQATLTSVAAIGTLMFALSTDVPVLILARAIMGIGAASALMTSFQAIVLWFPPPRWPQLNGWILAAGGIGGIIASLPTAFILHFTDWHGLMIGATAVTALVAVAVFVFVPEPAAPLRRASLAEQLGGLASVYTDRLFWRLAPVSATAAGCNLAFAGLWSGPWLKDVAGLGPDGIALSLLLLTVLLTVGYVVIGAVSTWLGRRGVSLPQIIGAGIALSILLQLPLLLPTGAGRWVVMVAVGAFGSMGALAYPVLNGHFGPALSGRVSTAMNLFVFVGAFFVQYAVGAVIDLFPQVAPGTYPAIAYQTAFGAMLALELLSWLWFLLPARK